MDSNVTENVLVPFDGTQLPRRAFMCVEGIAQIWRTQPIILGTSVPQEYLGRPLDVDEARKKSRARSLSSRHYISQECFQDGWQNRGCLS